jgi:hypothetical protein
MSEPKKYTVPRLVADNHVGGVVVPATPQLPANCPVKPLGKKGDVCFYLDAHGQFVALPAKEHTRLIIECMFGPYLGLLFTENYWPRKKKVGDIWIVDGWHAERGARALMQACGQIGLYEPLGHVRGTGAWHDSVNGLLMLHCGDQILVGETWHAPGKIGGYVYPAYAATLRPSEQFIAEGAPDNPAQELLAIFGTWQWRRGELDTRLLLGWMCAAMLGGAIKFRPVLWITGKQGSGKTTLMDALKAAFGNMLVQSADASPAYIWQKLKDAALPVLIDEQEPDNSGNRTVAARQAALIKLARIAASGSLLGRGGSDHEPEEFTARSCFLLSSILMPALTNQDRSRMAILELAPAKGTQPDLSEERMRRLAEWLYRRLVNNWSRFEKTLELLRESLRAEGHTARGADVFGTLLACLDLALHDHQMDAETAAAWAMELHASHLAETAEQTNDEDQVLQHLLSTLVPRNAPNARAIGELVRDAANEWGSDAGRANEILMNYGMKVARENNETVFAIANQHAELGRLFQGTQWETPAGLAGLWGQALRRLPQATVGRPQRFAGGQQTRATLLPIALVAPKEAPAPKPQQPNFGDEEEK